MESENQPTTSMANEAAKVRQKCRISFRGGQIKLSPVYRNVESTSRTSSPRTKQNKKPAATLVNTAPAPPSPLHLNRTLITGGVRPQLVLTYQSAAEKLAKKKINENLQTIDPENLTTQDTISPKTATPVKVYESAAIVAAKRHHQQESEEQQPTAPPTPTKLPKVSIDNVKAVTNTSPPPLTLPTFLTKNKVENVMLSSFNFNYPPPVVWLENPTVSPWYPERHKVMTTLVLGPNYENEGTTLEPDSTLGQSPPNFPCLNGQGESYRLETTLDKSYFTEDQQLEIRREYYRIRTAFLLRAAAAKQRQQISASIAASSVKKDGVTGIVKMEPSDSTTKKMKRSVNPPKVQEQHKLFVKQEI